MNRIKKWKMPKLIIHGHLRRHIIFVETVKILVICVCGQLFMTCCHWGVATIHNVSATQPSVQTYQQTKFYPLSALQYCVRNFHRNRWLEDTDRHIVWYHSTATELSSSFWVKKKKEKLNLYILKTFRYLPSLCPVWISMNVSDLKIEVNLKYAFTDRN
jgi:hypothetical protein